jgi:hypothetical protein
MKRFIILVLIPIFFGCIPESNTDQDLLHLYPLKTVTKKTLLCHNARTISVNENAIQAHLNHGDLLGECSARTFVPDDVFEQNLIDQGYDDVLDDYVLTENIENIIVLELIAAGDFTNNNLHLPILDYTGLEDFASLQELTLNSMAESLTKDIIDLSKNPNLKKLVFYQTDFNGIDLSGNQMLEDIVFQGTDEGGFFPCRISNLDLTANVNLKKLTFSIVNEIDDLDLTLERAPSIEELIFVESDYTVVNKTVEMSLVNNSNLREVHFGGDCLSLEFIDLKNGNNQMLELISFIPLCHISSTGGICIEADNPTYVSSITIAHDQNEPIDTVVTEDCNN